MNKYASRQGFTLIELLVVISIVLIASSIIFVGGNGGAGAALSSSQRIVSGIAQGARGQAILKSSKTRLIIHNDLDANPEKYHRFFGIVYESERGSGEWIAATQGTYLPEGIYFDPNVSSAHGWSTSSSMNLEYPRSVAKAEGGGEAFYYYEFESNGTMAPGFENDWLVIRSGTLKPGGTGTLDVVIDEAQTYLVNAIIFRRAGSTTLVNNPDSIL